MDCQFCVSKKTCSKMLDYDALIDINSNLAYPVYFKLKNSQKRKPQKSNKSIQRKA